MRTLIGSPRLATAALAALAFACVGQMGGPARAGGRASVLHPCDTDNNWRITITEVTAYGSAWKRGQVWPTPPNPIPIGYVTNCGYLWKKGEGYNYDDSQTPPWVPVEAPPPPP
jgi:hypothetical protein